jgi:aminoglycoside 3-N-acetyltransferase
MGIFDLYKEITTISPRIEIFTRKLYWNNISVFSRFRPKLNQVEKNQAVINFDKIIEYLNNSGIGNGQILIVHSSYDLLEPSGLDPDEINSKILDLVGVDGTLVMPAIRKYKEEGRINEYIKKDLNEVICTYDVRRSKVISGFLPFMLMQRDDCRISRFPLNPVVAVGKYADEMIKHNLEGDNPSPHGPNSSWKFCVDKNAVVIGLGVDMPHFLTITHVNEECSKEWPIRNWYRRRKFQIIDKDFRTYKEVLERQPVWGTIYLAENKYRKDLLSNNILKVEIVEGLKISILESGKLIEFLHNHSHKGYPYYVQSRHLIK